MKEEYFVNQAIDKGIKLYLESSDNEDSLTYNSFLVVAIRILVLIYGRLDILNPYYLKNKVSLVDNLSKYGISNSEIALFLEEYLNYYLAECENEKSGFKKENPHFKKTLKYLIDMFIAKRKSGTATYQEEEEFLELAYTTHTKNHYRISYNFLMNNNGNDIEKYYYSKINEFDVTREFSKTIVDNLNLEALNYVGVGLSNLNDMSSNELEAKKQEAYNYFEVDATSPMREKDLKDALSTYKSFGNKLSTGNGYVDILLLMSVIATTIAVITIIVLSI